MGLIGMTCALELFQEKVSGGWKCLVGGRQL